MVVTCVVRAADNSASRRPSRPDRTPHPVTRPVRRRAVVRRGSSRRPVGAEPSHGSPARANPRIAPACHAPRLARRRRDSRHKTARGVDARSRSPGAAYCIGYHFTSFVGAALPRSTSNASNLTCHRESPSWDPVGGLSRLVLGAASLFASFERTADGIGKPTHPALLLRRLRRRILCWLGLVSLR